MEPEPETDDDKTHVGYGDTEVEGTPCDADEMNEEADSDDNEQESDDTEIDYVCGQLNLGMWRVMVMSTKMRGRFPLRKLTSLTMRLKVLMQRRAFSKMIRKLLVRMRVFLKTRWRFWMQRTTMPRRG